MEKSKHFRTSDGTEFYNECDAKNHAKTLADKTVTPPSTEGKTESIIDDPEYTAPAIQSMMKADDTDGSHATTMASTSDAGTDASGETGAPLDEAQEGTATDESTANTAANNAAAPTATVTNTVDDTQEPALKRRPAQKNTQTAAKRKPAAKKQ